jgi:hypothetical protein
MLSHAAFDLQEGIEVSHAQGQHCCQQLPPGMAELPCQYILVKRSSSRAALRHSQQQGYQGNMRYPGQA